MIDFRPATVSDLPHIHEVWWAADPFDAFNHNPWFRHVIRTGSMVVGTVEGRIVGFAGVREVVRTIVVSDCFVDPEHQARGIGTRLLSLLLAEERPVMTLASSDPKARSLYSRFGMTSRWDCHYVEGDPTKVDRGMTSAVEVGVYPVEESDFPHLRDDLRCRFLEGPGGNAAIAPAEIESSVAPAAADPVQVLRASLGWTAERGDRRMRLHLSDRHPMFPVLIEAGFVVTGADTLMASPGAVVPDPTRTTFNGDILRITE